ncbi:hypothetical protein C8N35_101812 [Breoghania corrubedonensis]|uniref:Uncharacterized protein n=1 Tax=Breoghania corrubedonensis TaxID=665038 RepID=A0A2T5VG67_9HYPH|nr:DUF2470 domain-containing protein [Breoghania corrubedonensis]PTW62764.1 hypothetical protein C8N35_101812 [Breoghania corrubedonensis]
MNETDDFQPITAARKILRSAATGALATLEVEGGAPYASLVTVATDFEGAPVLLLSDLALHTRNLKADSRVSLLLEERNAFEPLQGARLSLAGTIARVDEDARVRRRFLARHRDAEDYAGFRDFGFYRVTVERGHLVAGFGRINDIAGKDLLSDVAGADALAAAEEDIVSHMNQDHGDALTLYATRLIGMKGDVGEEGWIMTGCDPDGIDLRNGDGQHNVRLAFERSVTDASGMRTMLVAYAKTARHR